MDAMRLQDFDRAWEISDQVLRSGGADRRAKHTGPRHLQKIWHGEPLKGARVLIRCYHGLGDTLQFIRLAKPLRSIAREVIVWCQPQLVGLVRSVPGVDRVLPLHDGRVEAPFDVDIEVMELAHALRITPSMLGHHIPYLSVRPERVGVGSRDLHVGVAWQAGGWDPRRSLPLPALSALAMPGVRLYVLQPSIGCLPGPFRDRSSASIDTLTARMAGLDAIVSVDTMAAHLAGALGLRVLTLLHADCDWRWGSRGSSSVWYPTMSLCRQQIAGDWDAPIAQASEALRELRMEVRART